MLGILMAMSFIPDQQTPLLFGIISLGVLVAGYGVRARFGRATEPV
jgi:GABA permease